MSLDVYLSCDCCGEDVYEANITHNLNTMAGEAGLYFPLWRPLEIEATIAEDIIQPLTVGLEKLLADPETFKQFNPENGWGDYDGLVRFTRNYLAACIKFPNSVILASR